MKKLTPCPTDRKWEGQIPIVSALGNLVHDGHNYRDNSTTETVFPGDQMQKLQGGGTFKGGDASPFSP
jgi:hypothetical protein